MNVGAALVSVGVTLLIIAVITDWVTNSNGPTVVTSTANVVAKIIDVSLGKDTK